MGEHRQRGKEWMIQKQGGLWVGGREESISIHI